MQHDGFDGIVVGELLELRDDDLRAEDDPFQVHHADLVPEPAERRSRILPGMQRNVDQRKDREHEEEEPSSSDHDPKPNARTLLVRHIEGCSLAPEKGWFFSFVKRDVLADNNPDCRRRDAYLHRSLANVFSVSVNRTRYFRLQTQPLSLEVIDVVDAEVTSEIHRGEQTE